MFHRQQQLHRCASALIDPAKIADAQLGKAWQQQMLILWFILTLQPHVLFREHPHGRLLKESSQHRWGERRSWPFPLGLVIQERWFWLTLRVNQGFQLSGSCIFQTDSDSLKCYLNLPRERGNQTSEPSCTTIRTLGIHVRENSRDMRKTKYGDVFEP